MAKLKKMLLWVLPLIVIISVQSLRAQETTTLEIYTTDTVDVCKSDKRVIVIVSLGNVLKSDNLVYFDIELKYDPKKLKFDQILSSGTLSEQFADEIEAQGIFSGVGYMRAYAGSFKDIPAVGNKPVLAFLGTSLVSCPDTTEVVLASYDLQEYKRTITDTISAVVIAREGKSNNRYISLTGSKNTVNLNDTVTTQEVVFNLKGTEGTRISEGILKVEYNSSSFKVSQVVSETPNIEIVKIHTSETGLEITFKTLDSNSQAERGVRATFERLEDTTKSDTVKVFIKDVNDCSCVTLLKDTVEIEVNNNKRIVNSITDGTTAFKNLKVHNESDRWTIEIDDEWQAEVYSILGQIKGKYFKKGNTIKIEKESFEPGIYLLVLKNLKNHSQEIRILNK